MILGQNNKKKFDTLQNFSDIDSQLFDKEDTPQHEKSISDGTEKDSNIMVRDTKNLDRARTEEFHSKFRRIEYKHSANTFF